MKNKLSILFLLCTYVAIGQSNDTCVKVPIRPINEGLIAYYPFNGNAQDASPNGNNGVVSGAILTVDRFNQQNKAYSFNGSSAFISINKGLQLSQNYTVSAWINTNILSSNWQTVISKYETNLYGPYWFGVHLDRPNAWISNGSGTYTFFDSDRSIPTNRWIHLVWTGQGTVGKVYVNGVLDGTRTIPLMTQNNDLVTIGKQVVWAGFDSYCWFNGSLDEIRLYNRAFTPCEITDLYDKERLPTTATNDIAHQDFSISPNPTHDKLTINLKNTEESLKATITDITGRILLIQHNTHSAQVEMDIKSLVNGLYLLEIKMDGHKTIQKFIKN
jgi:Concanavalin A-like lectin/glucanases superfamily/Secretion system C-terminal sorting domain